MHTEPIHEILVLILFLHTSHHPEPETAKCISYNACVHYSFDYSDYVRHEFVIPDDVLSVLGVIEELYQLENLVLWDEVHLQLVDTKQLYQ